MKVYVVTQHWAYEGAIVLGVAATMEAGKALAEADSPEWRGEWSAGIHDEARPGGVERHCPYSWYQVDPLDLAWQRGLPVED